MTDTITAPAITLPRDGLFVIGTKNKLAEGLNFKPHEAAFRIVVTITQRHPIGEYLKQSERKIKKQLKSGTNPRHDHKYMYFDCGEVEVWAMQIDNIHQFVRSVEKCELVAMHNGHTAILLNDV